MKIPSFSVNVMDERGLIIASGNPERRTSATRGRAGPDREPGGGDQRRHRPSAQGVRPGINLPIAYRGELLG